MGYVTRSHSPQSTFWQWFSTRLVQQLGLNPTIVQAIYEGYRIGATKRGNVIFWQIDSQQRVRTGHVMRISASTNASSASICSTSGQRRRSASWKARRQPSSWLPCNRNTCGSPPVAAAD